MSDQVIGRSLLSTRQARKLLAHSTPTEVARGTRKRSSVEAPEGPRLAVVEFKGAAKAGSVSEVPVNQHRAVGDSRKSRASTSANAPDRGSAQAAATQENDCVSRSNKLDNLPKYNSGNLDSVLYAYNKLQDSLADLAQDARMCGFHQAALLLARAAAQVAEIRHAGAMHDSL